MRYVDFYEKYWKSRIALNELKRGGAMWRFNNLIKIIPQQIKFNSVLEIGAGTGTNIRILNESSNWNLIVCLDIAKSALSIIKKDLPHTHLIQCDAHFIPIKDNTIDLVLLVDILEHLEKPELTLHHAKRIGRYVLLKIPLEKAFLSLLFTKFKRRERIGIGRHKGGHLVEWNKKDAFKLLNNAKLTILNYKITDPPESIRYRDYKYQKKKFIKRIMKKLFIILEKKTCLYFPTVHRILYGSTLFVFCKT